METAISDSNILSVRGKQRVSFSHTKLMKPRPKHTVGKRLRRSLASLPCVKHRVRAEDGGDGDGDDDGDEYDDEEQQEQQLYPSYYDQWRRVGRSDHGHLDDSEFGDVIHCNRQHQVSLSTDQAGLSVYSRDFFLDSMATSGIESEAVLAPSGEEAQMFCVSPLGDAAIEISEENLEDLLAYDDLFLDYFNAFLALPVFPQPLYYNRLTGTFLEVNGTGASALSGEFLRPATPPYGATDEERERMLEWAKDERLPLFLRTRLFREFKLCKLLLRVLDDRDSASRGNSSRMIRGYSRQTESYVSSLSNSADNSANDIDFDDDGGGEPWAEVRRLSGVYRRHRRPGSRAVSLPTRLGLARVYSNSASSLTSSHTISKETSNISNGKYPASAGSKNRRTAQGLLVSAAGDGPVHTQGGAGSITHGRESPRSGACSGRDSDAKEAKRAVGERNRASRDGSARTSSSRSSHKSSIRHAGSMEEGAGDADKENRVVVVGHQGEAAVVEGAVCEDYDVVFGEEEPEPTAEPYVAFAEDMVSDQQTEVYVKELEGKHNMSLQQMKEQVLGSVEGMDQFRHFLQDTVGSHLLNFWLDCENFKDVMEDYDEEENMATRKQLFREIQDRYKVTLTEDAKRQLARSACNAGLSYTIFIRTQYDVLRRIRTYWVPRFLIHKERLDELSQELRREMVPLDDRVTMERQASSTCFFPSISLVNSMPVRADDAMHIAKTTSWDKVSKAGRQWDERVKSAKPHVRVNPSQRTLREKLVLALIADKSAGGPFRMFLERSGDDHLLSKLLFWEDVTEYGASEDRSADRLLRMCHAWNIFNKYISVNSPNNIGISPEEQDHIHSTLLTARDFIEASLFNNAKNLSIDLLEKAWIRFLKEDLKAFIDCHIRSAESPPGTAEEIEVVFDDIHDQLIVRRLRPWFGRYPPSTDSERGQRLSVAESVDEGRRAEQRKRAKERRKQMEKERRKAVRAARQRLKQAKQHSKKVSFSKKSNGDGLSQADDTESRPYTEGTEARRSTGQQQPQEERIPTFADSSSNKGIMTLFKKYMADGESRELLNLLNLSMDIDAYQSLGDNKVGRQKKDIQANFVYKTYIEQGAKKKVPLNDKVYTRLKADKDRPRTPTLKEIQQCVSPQLEEVFKNFYENQAEELGIDSKNLATMSKAELAMHSDDPSLINWQKKKGRSGKDGTSTPPSGTDGQDDDSSNPLLALSNVSASVLKLAFSDNDLKMPPRKKRGGGGGLNTSRSQTVVSNATDATGSSTAAGGIAPQDEEEWPAEQPVLEPELEEVEFSPGEEPSGTTPQRRKKKSDGRSQPTKEDKVNFLLALNEAAGGHLPQKMLYFYRYLSKHGEDDGVPLIDHDLFFYCEVHKFKECTHAFADEEMLRRKIQSILDVYLESSTPPVLQIDIPIEVQQRTIRAAQRYLTGKDTPASIFDEAQYTVFKELLPYWAGFIKNFKNPDDDQKRPITRRQKERMRRLEGILSWKPPSVKAVLLPQLPKGTSVTAFSYSINEGIKWRDRDYWDDLGNQQLDVNPHLETMSVSSSTKFKGRASMSRTNSETSLKVKPGLSTIPAHKGSLAIKA